MLPRRHYITKQFLTLLLLLICSNSFGQFAIVNDKDSYLNIREDGLQTSKVIDKLQNGHLVYCFELKGNWVNIDYTKKGKEFNGYIYKDRFKLVSDFPAFIIYKKATSSLRLKMDNIEVTLTQSKFDKKLHRFKYYKESNQIEFIDNKKYWGTDGGMPTTQYEEIIIKVGSKTTSLPKIALEGLYEPGIYNAEVNYDKGNDTFYIQTMNSDGAGSYIVIWKVEKGVYKDRLIAYGF